jgi:hypothetical protein
MPLLTDNVWRGMLSQSINRARAIDRRRLFLCRNISIRQSTRRLMPKESPRCFGRSNDPIPIESGNGSMA